MDAPEKQLAQLENAERIGYLIGGFISKTLSIEEREELDRWVAASDANMELFDDLTDENKVHQFLKWLASRDTETQLIRAKANIKFEKPSRPVKWWHYAAAAMLIGVVGWLVVKPGGTSRNTPPVVTTAGSKADIKPGGNLAELRLASGDIIRLDETTDTSFANIDIANGMIRIQNESAQPEMFELHTPRKGSYVLLLSDGTRVWLNAESSIRYPSSFLSAKREVSVSGESFFEVAKDPSRPFIVALDRVHIRALGTAFNVDGFNSAITLTEGKVEVSTDTRHSILLPGQQLKVESWSVERVEVSPITSWTRNEFEFRNASIREVMEPIARWYDLSVRYEAENSYHLNGTISRNVPLSKVLSLLEATGKVNFRLEGNKLYVQ